MRDFFRYWRRHLSSVWVVVLVLSVGFFFFSPGLVLVEIFFGVGVWMLLDEIKPTPSSFSRTRLGVFFFLLGLLLLLSRVFPFFFSATPLGYDTGIYRYEIWSSFQQLPTYVSQLFLGLPLISTPLLLFGGSLDATVFFLTVMAGLLPALAIVLFGRRQWGTEVGMVALFLFVFSLIQWKAYEMILLKQLFALALVFLCFWLFQRRSFLVVLLGAFLALLQPLDAFLLAVSALVFFFYAFLARLPERRYFSALMALGLAGLMFFSWLEPSFWRQAWDIFSAGVTQPHELESSLRQGVFLSLADYGYQSAVLFVLGLLGAFSSLRHSRPTILHAYLLILLVWIASGLFFYQRLLIQLDAILLCFAAVTISALWQVFRSDRFGRASLFFIALGLVVPSFLHWARFEPAISPQELSSIQTFCSELPEGTSVAATDSGYGPWLRGYCLRQLVFGPGLFEENRWSEAEWRSFWDGDTEVIARLLSRYEGVVYFYVGKKQPQIDFDQGLFEWVEGGWWKGEGSSGT